MDTRPDGYSGTRPNAGSCGYDRAGRDTCSGGDCSAGKDACGYAEARERYAASDEATCCNGGTGGALGRIRA